MTRCPRCNRPSKTPGDQPHTLYCHECRMYFDASGDDGTTGYGRPDRYAEKREEYQQRQQKRQGRRGRR